MGEIEKEQLKDEGLQKEPVIKKDGGLKGLIIGIIILTIVALAGIGFGVWGMIAKDQAEKNAAICDGGKTGENEEEMGNVSLDGNDTSGNESTVCQTETVDTGTVSNNESSKDYLYVGEWGLKIKIPKEILYLEYEYTLVNDTEQLCLMGARAEDKNYTTLINLDGDLSPMGCVVRGHSGSYPIDGTYPGLGTIFAIDDFTFRIYGPQDDPDVDDYTKDVYTKNKVIIYSMLNNPENYSAI